MEHIPADDFIIKDHAEKHAGDHIGTDDPAVLIKQQKKGHDSCADPVKKHGVEGKNPIGEADSEWIFNCGGIAE